jgi:hypothetical protein
MPRPARANPEQASVVNRLHDHGATPMRRVPGDDLTVRLTR